MSHILIVEDEAGIIQFLKQGLNEEDYKVTTTPLKCTSIVLMFNKT